MLGALRALHMLRALWGHAMCMLGACWACMLGVHAGHARGACWPCMLSVLWVRAGQARGAESAEGALGARWACSCVGWEAGGLRVQERANCWRTAPVLPAAGGHSHLQLYLHSPECGPDSREKLTAPCHLQTQGFHKELYNVLAATAPIPQISLASQKFSNLS